MVVPYPPGGNMDTMARIVADRLGPVLGERVIVENKPGGQTVIGLENAMHSAPDGHTLLAAANTSFNILPNLRKVPYDAERSFEAVAQLGTIMCLVVVRSESPIRTLADLVEAAKRDPGKLTYGTVGMGSFANLAMESLKQEFGIDILHVPYKGSAETLNGLLGGQTDVIIDAVVLSHVRSGRLRALAAYLPFRHPELPDVPSIAEAGVKRPVAPPDGGIFVPRGTPPAVVGRLASELRKIVAEPDVKTAMLRQSLAPTFVDGPQYGARLKEASLFNREVIRIAGIKDE